MQARSADADVVVDINDRILGLVLPGYQTVRGQHRNDFLDALKGSQRRDLQYVFRTDQTDDGPFHPFGNIGLESELGRLGQDLFHLLGSRVGFKNDDHMIFSRAATNVRFSSAVPMETRI